MQKFNLLQFPSDESTTVDFVGARVARSAYNAKYRTVSLRGSLIENVSMPGVADPHPGSGDDITIDLSGYMILPGLINAHDHLDFSLFPRLGRGPYPSWREWAADIHLQDASPIHECLRVPSETRIAWGGVRNLLSGVTTVSHHNPYLHQVFGSGFPVHVPYEYGWAHSLAEPNRLVKQFHQTPRNRPFILHLAEGTDDASQRELDALQSLLPLDQRMLLVHCVGLTSYQWENIRRSGAGIIWCPSSNLYTLGRTLAVDKILSFPNIALGTDSPLTAAGDLLDELQLVHTTLGVPAPLVYELVTSRPAQLLRLKNGQGSLQVRAKADLVVTRDKQLMPAETLVQLSWGDIDLVIEGGRITLLSATLAARVPARLKQGMEWVSVDGVERLLRAPIRKLLSEASMNTGRAPIIGGREFASVDKTQIEACDPLPLRESEYGDHIQQQLLS